MLRGSLDFRLYLITDRKLFPDAAGLFDAVEEVLEGGVKAVQLREKDLPVRQQLEMAYILREITGRHGALLFINDRVDVAVAVGADGVHLGGEGIPLSAARKVCGEKMLIGVSTHSAAGAAEAGKHGADFVTLGPVYETPAKMKYGRPLGTDVLRQAAGKSETPVFAIGGITAGRVQEVKDAGAYGVAVISAILAAGSVKSSTEEFMRLLQ